jgi:hypothetical protein
MEEGIVETLETKAYDSLFLQSGHSNDSITCWCAKQLQAFPCKLFVLGAWVISLRLCGGSWCRMSSNRASAQRSRQRKQERLDELEILV